MRYACCFYMFGRVHVSHICLTACKHVDVVFMHTVAVVHCIYTWAAGPKVFDSIVWTFVTYMSSTSCFLSLHEFLLSYEV